MLGSYDFVISAVVGKLSAKHHVIFSFGRDRHLFFLSLIQKAFQRLIFEVCYGSAKRVLVRGEKVISDKARALLIHDLQHPTFGRSSKRAVFAWAVPRQRKAERLDETRGSGSSCGRC